MQSKNKPSMTASERRHVTRVRMLPCSLCDATGPSEAHEIEQGLWFTSIALCVACHRGKGGWHGDKTLWRIYKSDETKALNVTIGRLNGAPVPSTEEEYL